ncbi:phosphatase [Halioglobus pacificus]|uniref:Phosphatase n=1 Tax=Parahalioglobus pacificus TaxID=930806 RepID=A0A919CI60_9GAMM|nr:phosphatase [Halioglobus pacificus]
MDRGGLTRSEVAILKTVLIDFHTHSTASDGALDPLVLLERAQAAGVTAFAITDHDTIAGYEKAIKAFSGPMQLLPGVELSCQWASTTIHVVGLNFDPEHPTITAGLAQLDKARADRGQKIDERLAKRGMPGALAGALEKAGTSQLGRPHFAAWMVEQGHVADINEAFDKFLGQGKPGDVKAYWPELATVTGWIVDSGGIPVMAHPLKYRFTRMKLKRLLEDFQQAGGRALELLSGRGSLPEQRAQLERLARELGLAVSGGSDFHRDGPYAPKLGVELRHFADLTPIWELLTPPPTTRSPD